MEKTNFYDAVYSPVILILNAIVVAVVMLLSASGNPTVLKLFGMSAGTAVAVINYISQIFTRSKALVWKSRQFSLRLPVWKESMSSTVWRRKKAPAAIAERTEQDIAAELKRRYVRIR